MIVYDLYKYYRILRASKDSYRCARGFVMHVSDHESYYADGDSQEVADNSSMVSGRRFACDELYMRYSDNEYGCIIMSCLPMNYFIIVVGCESVAHS